MSDIVKRQQGNEGLTRLEASVLQMSKTGERIDRCKRAEIVLLFQEMLVIIGAGDVNIPEPEEMKFIVDRAPLAIGKWTTSEVRHALSLALQGVIEFDLNLYNKPFSLRYVSELMREYEPLKNKTVITQRQQSPQLEAAAPTAEEINAQLRAWALKAFSNHIEDKAIWHDYNPVLYDYFKREGVINLSPEKEESMKKLAFATVKDEMIVERHRAPASEQQVLKVLLESLDPSNNLVTRKFKELAVKDFFISLSITKTELSSLI